MHRFYFTAFLIVIAFASTAQSDPSKSDSIQFEKNVFRLGEVIVTARLPTAFGAVGIQKIEAYNKLDVSTALNLLPGVNLSKVGARNESVVLLRGFDLRQVPVYIDGIPVYVPYDGYVDLGRFTTFDVSKISVSKGFSSIVYGANTMGGAINIISRKPLKKFELDARAGLISGDGHRLSLNVGSNLGKFYLQGGVSQLKQDYYPLSGKFEPVPNEDGDERENSYREDNKYSIKFGFTPKASDEYAISYTKQDGAKGNPEYVGSDPLQRPRFWRWPYWDKESIYFISTTGITKTSSITTRLFYDKFKNLLSAFDDNKYLKQTRPSSFNSYYNDNSYGGSAEYNNELSRQHQLKAAVHFKQDRHRENNAGEPVRTFKDYTASVGVEDIYRVSGKFTLLPGISVNHRNSKLAQDYNAQTKQITAFPDNDNYAINAQLGAVYALTDDEKINASIARKTRFATVKDRYSYRMGAAIPNPDLKAETALHLEAGYNATHGKLTTTTNLFYSHITDVIQQVNNVQPNVFQLQNAGKAEFYGAELSLNYAILKGWTGTAQYSYLHRENISNKELKFIDAPEHKILIASGYEYKNLASLVANFEYNSGRYSTSYGINAGDFAIINISVNAKLYRWISLQGGLNNLFDRNYAISEGFPEAGRNFFINLIFSNF
jgi:iron complex outermembrane recepter protein